MNFLFTFYVFVEIVSQIGLGRTKIVQIFEQAEFGET